MQVFPCLLRGFVNARRQECSVAGDGYRDTHKGDNVRVRLRERATLHDGKTREPGEWVNWPVADTQWLDSVRPGFLPWFGWPTDVQGYGRTS